MACAQGASAASSSAPSQYDAIIAKHAAATGVPETLIRRIIVRESRYNPSARNGGHYGMMQIKPATAKSMGYQGGAAGLLDADTNLTYGVRYLAGAYKVAGGNHDRAVRLYASGYYYDAKRKGMLADVGLGRNAKPFAPVPATPTAPTVAVAAAPAAPAVKIATRVATATPAAQAATPRAVAAASPRVISPSATPALASSLPTLSPTAKPVAPSSRVATAAAAVGGLQRVASAEPATPDPKASAYSNGRQPVSTPFAGVSAPRATTVPTTPPLPPVARATPPAAAPTLAAVATPAKIARPLAPATPVAAAVPTPPERDPMLATASTEPRAAPQVVRSAFPRSR